VSLAGLPDLQLKGSLAFEVNQLGREINTTITPLSGPDIPLVFTTADSVQRVGGSLDLTVTGFTKISGQFGFERNATSTPPKISIAAQNVSAFLGSDGGTADVADDVGVQISNARFGGVFYKGETENTYAFDAQGEVELINIPGIILDGSLAARVNTTGGAVNETITVPGFDPVQLAFAETDVDPVFSGTIVNAEIAEFASVSGWFSVTKGSDRLTIAAADINTFVGAGDSGISVTDGKLGAVVDAATGNFALVASGAVESQNITGLKVTGDDGTVRINLLGRGITETITTPAGDVVLDFANGDQLLRLEGPVSIEVAGFVDIDADVVVEKRISGDTTSLLVQATHASAFLGTGSTTEDTADDMGVRLTDGSMDLRIRKNLASGVSNYAFAARGSIELVGIPSILAKGSLIATRSTLSEPIVLDFGTTDESDNITVDPGTTEFGGSVELAIGGFAKLAGNFGFKRETAGDVTKIKLAATNVSAFLGTDSGTPDTADDVGVEITTGRLGAVFYRRAGANSYAFNASGDAEFKNIPGLILEGNLSARINTTGGAVNETIT
ncbi:MAG: hypothetical protein ACKOEO_14595, partial [Planctomycetaceae bacterium]